MSTRHIIPDYFLFSTMQSFFSAHSCKIISYCIEWYGITVIVIIFFVCTCIQVMYVQHNCQQNFICLSKERQIVSGNPILRYFSKSSLIDRGAAVVVCISPLADWPILPAVSLGLLFHPPVPGCLRLLVQGGWEFRWHWWSSPEAEDQWS